jgi:hypothetical protein
MSEALKHPATGDPIELAEGEQLWRIDWPGKPVLVITRASGDGETQYRLAHKRCTTWNQVGPMKLAPWPAPEA